MYNGLCFLYSLFAAFLFFRRADDSDRREKNRQKTDSRIEPCILQTYMVGNAGNTSAKYRSTKCDPGQGLPLRLFLQCQTKCTKERNDRHAPEYCIDAFLPAPHIAVVIVMDPDIPCLRSRRTIHCQDIAVPSVRHPCVRIVSRDHLRLLKRYVAPAFVIRDHKRHRLCTAVFHGNLRILRRPEDDPAEPFRKIGSRCNDRFLCSGCFILQPGIIQRERFSRIVKITELLVPQQHIDHKENPDHKDRQSFFQTFFHLL